MSEQKRNISVDIIRCLAFFLVVSVHFFLQSGFYSQTVAGERMLVMNIMRALFIICVPLFITLSGYLLCKKELSLKYYKRIVGILLTYVLSSVVCILYSHFFLEEKLTLAQFALKIFNFTGAPYSWYIEMYLGLFLIIPFLNVLYNNIPSQNWKRVLVISFIALTSLPAVLNTYNFSSLSWWALPSSNMNTHQLFPEWWEGIYPVTYYFVGCYLREYGLKIKKSINLILIIAVIIFSGLYTYWRSYGYVFVWGDWCEYYSLFNVVLTALVFNFIINIKFDKTPAPLAKFIQKISGLCLGGYLLSWIFDSIFYPVLKEKVTNMPSRLEYYFLIVPVVYILSLAGSYVISKIVLLLELAFAKAAKLMTPKR